MPAFLAAMNRKARAIGMLESHFEDPTGLTSHNVSTAFDLAKMVAAAHDYPLIRELTTNAESTINIDGRELIYRNTNPLVRNTTWNVGLSKTGYISEAGRCLVMQAHLAGRPVVIVLLDSVGSMTRVGDANRIKQWMEGVHGRARQPIHAAAGRSATRTTG
jgi:D-alanyl-D-alanine endopeptidase (penicillin-binding protein 7)